MGRRFRALLAAGALAATALPASAQAQGQVQAPTVLSEDKGFLRHAPTGISLPPSLAGIPRAANIPGNPAVVIYTLPGLKPDDPRRFAVAIGRAQAPPEVERMRQQSRLHAGGGKAVDTLIEGAFDWPGHPGARTFRGSYLAGGIRKQYWNAWAAGYGVTVMAEWPAGDAGQMEKIEAAIAAQVFGARPSAER